MIEKMKFLRITGPKDDIDRVVDQYLSKYEIHLENALSELKSVSGLRPYVESNPYKGELQTAVELASAFHEPLPASPKKEVTIEEAVRIVHHLDEELKKLSAKRDALIKEQDRIQTSISNIIPFADLNYEVRDILNFKYVRFRFGRMSITKNSWLTPTTRSTPSFTSVRRMPSMSG